MDRAVYKYEVIAAGGFSNVSMPVAAEILHADAQDQKVFVWALVDLDAPSRVNRRLGYFGTGRESIPPTARHIGTCLNRDFGLVWHVFEDFPEATS